jgi:hypothetical membrane protein
VLLFASFGLGSAAYAIEMKSKIASLALIIGLSSWILYEAGAYHAGVAVPEAISSLATGLWITVSAINILQGK